MLFWLNVCWLAKDRGDNHLYSKPVKVFLIYKTGYIDLPDCPFVLSNIIRVKCDSKTQGVPYANNPLIEWYVNAVAFIIFLNNWLDSAETVGCFNIVYIIKRETDFI